MASAINFNTVWTSIFEPLPTFGFLDRLGKECLWGPPRPRPPHRRLRRLRRGAPGRLAVRNWKVGDRVMIHCNHVDDQDPTAHDDSMLAANQRIWGFETNFGGLADLAVVKANQLMPKPATSPGRRRPSTPCATRRRTACSCPPTGPGWSRATWCWCGAPTGGLGSYAVQHVLNGGGTPIGMVSSPDKVALLHELGIGAVIDRKAAATGSGPTSTPRTSREWRRFGKDIRALVGDDPDIVFEHPAARPWGVGLRVQARRDHRDLRGDLRLHDRVRQPPPVDEAQDDQGLALRQLPRGVGRQPAICDGRSSRRCRPSTRWGGGRGRVPGPPQSARGEDRRPLPGPAGGLGIDDPERRAEIGEDQITAFRRHGA